MSKPAIFVTRAIFPEVLEHLGQHFEVHSNQADIMWTPTEPVSYTHLTLPTICSV